MLELVVVGHLSRDLIITPQTTREALGGGTAYAMVAPRLEVEKAGIVSKIGKDFNQEYLDILEQSGLDLRGLHQVGEKSTRFVNRYDTAGQRIQTVDALAKQITPEDFPEDYFDATMVHFSPLSPKEIEIGCFELARSKAEMTSIDVQGYVRSIESDGTIKPRSWIEAEEILSLVDVVKFHDSELQMMDDYTTEIEAVSKVLQRGPKIVLVTRDKRGSTVYSKNTQFGIPMINAEHEVDATGCGDVYTISFLLEYIRSNDLKQAGLFAASCSSFNAETIGPYKFPSRAAVEKRLNEY